MSRFLSAAFCALFIVSVGSTEAKAAYDEAKGQAVYETTCAVCHKVGIMGATKLGDKAGWKPRIDKGMTVLVDNAVKGFKGAAGVMPPKGGKATLTEAEVGNAVAYMVKQSK